MNTVNKNIKNIIADGLYILVGSMLTAFGFAVFTVPNNIAPGGVSGLATAISHLSGLPVGLLTFVLNVPIIAVALRKMKIAAVVKTIVTTLLLSVGIDLFIAFVPPYTNNTLMAAFAGGVIMGAGVGLVISRGITTGGTDLIGLMIRSGSAALTLGQILMIIDTLIVGFAVVVFKDVDVALYSVVTIFIVSKTLDVIQAGIEHQKIIYIISDRSDEILQTLVGTWERGVTVLDVYGGYQNQPKKMLMLVARRTEIAQTLHLVRSVDPRSFTILSDASEVHGEGFKEIQQIKESEEGKEEKEGKVEKEGKKDQ